MADVKSVLRGQVSKDFYGMSLEEQVDIRSKRPIKHLVSDTVFIDFG